MSFYVKAYTNNVCTIAVDFSLRQGIFLISPDYHALQAWIEDIKKEYIFAIMIKPNRKSHTTEKSFLAQNIILYHVCSTLWFAGSLVLLLILVKGDYIKPAPGFLERLLIKHDWLTILYFPLVAVLLFFCINFACEKYKWYCRRITYTTENGEIIIIHRSKCSRIKIKDIVQISCRLRRSFFPLQGHGSPLCTYYDLVIELPNCKFRFCSTPFEQYKEPEDFMQFIEFLKSLRLSFKMKETAFYKYRIWKLKVNKKRNKI